jgi:hypothetical protein
MMQREENAVAASIRTKRTSNNSTRALIVWGIILLGAGVWMLVDPTVFDKGLDNEDRPSSRRTNALLTVLEPIWSRPAGLAVAPLGGLLLVLGAVRVRDAAADGRTSPMNPGSGASRS